MSDKERVGMDNLAAVSGGASQAVVKEIYCTVCGRYVEQGLTDKNAAHSAMNLWLDLDCPHCGAHGQFAFRNMGETDPGPGIS